MSLVEVRIAFNLHAGTPAEQAALNRALDGLQRELRKLGADVIPSVALIDGRERIIITTNGPFGSAAPPAPESAPPSVVSTVWTQRSKVAS